MVFHAQLDTPLRNVQDSSWASGVSSSGSKGAAVSQAAGGYMAVDNFMIVKPVSRDRSRDFTGSASDIRTLFTYSNGRLTVIEADVQEDANRGTNYFEMGYRKRKRGGRRRLRDRLRISFQQRYDGLREACVEQLPSVLVCGRCWIMSTQRILTCHGPCIDWLRL